MVSGSESSSALRDCSVPISTVSLMTLLPPREAAAARPQLCNNDVHYGPGAVRCKLLGNKAGFRRYRRRKSARGVTMDFDWDVDQRAFRASVRAFLAAHLPSDWESLVHGPASESQSAFSKKFCKELAGAGLLVPHWPARWGGRDADPWIAFILAEEMWEAGEPRGGQYMNVNWIGPTLMRFGSEGQQARYIPPMARGETIWCQGFSEPEAGSDLASLRTRAEKQGTGYRINGQKIWTSYAGHADICFLLARTSPGKDGISVF